MNTHTLHIKNMVCPRCITAVKELVKKLNYTLVDIKLGEAIVKTDNLDLNLIRAELNALGFELLEDKRLQIIDNSIIFLKGLRYHLYHH